MAESGFSLADQLFNAQKVGYLAGLFRAADPGFAVERFQAEVMADLPDLALKQRITLIAQVLERYLPDSFPESVAAILAMLPPPLDPSRTDDDFGDFIFAPLSDYVARNGTEPENLPHALHALYQITQRFSCEFAIREFLNAAPEQTLDALCDWQHDDNYHVRRLVSEGTRPKLPWGKKLTLPIDVGLEFLDSLHADRTRYVTRSVANHLNDISKSDPDMVIERLVRWRDAGQQSSAELDWITRHALRGQIKAGAPRALALLGYDPDPVVNVGRLRVVPQTIEVGEKAELSVELTPIEDGPLLVDYVIDKRRADGTAAPRVGKWTTVEGRAGQSLTLIKSLRFARGASTVTWYPVPHRVFLQLNGRRLAETVITLTG